MCFILRFLRFPVFFPVFASSLRVPTKHPCPNHVNVHTKSGVFYRKVFTFSCVFPVFASSIRVPTKHPCPNHLEVAQIWTSRRISFLRPQN